jgi:hypothetical protein
MPDLIITVGTAEVVPFALSPTIAFRLNIVNADHVEPVHTVVLRCQIRIDVSRRRYTTAEKAKLRDLFDEPERWGQTLRDLLWANISVVVPPFTGATTIDLHVPCTFDFNIPTTKYFHGLTDGDIPVHFLFSGTVFYEDAGQALRVAPISWDKETKFRLPLKIWKDMMDHYYPNTAWLTLRRDVFEDLYSFKVERGIPTWEQAFEKLLETSTEASAVAPGARAVAS